MKTGSSIIGMLQRMCSTASKTKRDKTMATLSPYEIINMEHQDHDKKYYTRAQDLLTCHVSDYNKFHSIPIAR